MQTFTKAERLCSKVVIEKVFTTGKTIVQPSFKLFWLAAEPGQAYPIQVVITVPKRNFKRAVDRNKLKRRIREAYRKQKDLVYKQAGEKRYSIMISYTGKNIVEYKEIEQKIGSLLQRFIQESNK